jgi:hypothetical protein
MVIPVHCRSSTISGFGHGLHDLATPLRHPGDAAPLPFFRRAGLSQEHLAGLATDDGNAGCMMGIMPILSSPGGADASLGVRRKYV